MSLPDKLREKIDVAIEESGVLIIPKTSRGNGNSDALIKDVVEYVESRGYSQIINETMNEYGVSLRLKSEGERQNA